MIGHCLGRTEGAVNRALWDCSHFLKWRQNLDVRCRFLSDPSTCSAGSHRLTAPGVPGTTGSQHLGCRVPPAHSKTRLGSRIEILEFDHMFVYHWVCRRCCRRSCCCGGRTTSTAPVTHKMKPKMTPKQSGFEMCLGPAPKVLGA